MYWDKINNYCIICSILIKKDIYIKNSTVETYKKRKFCNKKCYLNYKFKHPEKYTHAGLNGKSNPMYGKIGQSYKKCFYDKTLGHHVRSNWERNILLILKENNIDYAYEKKTFELPNINATYTPDIIIKDIVISIKGYLEKSALLKEQEFRKEYPNYKYITITHYKNFNSYNFVDSVLNYKEIIKNNKILLNEV
jgi:hypothetical protein